MALLTSLVVSSAFVPSAAFLRLARFLRSSRINPIRTNLPHHLKTIITFCLFFRCLLPDSTASGSTFAGLP